MGQIDWAERKALRKMGDKAVKIEIGIPKSRFRMSVDVDVDALPAASRSHTVIVGLSAISWQSDFVRAFNPADGNIECQVPYEAVIRAGLTSQLRQAAVSVERESDWGLDVWHEAMRGRVEAKIEALMSGDVRIGGSGPRVSDPIRQRAIELASAVAKARLASGGNAKPEAKEIRRLAIEIVDAEPKFMRAAEASARAEAEALMALSED